MAHQIDTGNIDCAKLLCLLEGLNVRELKPMQLKALQSLKRKLDTVVILPTGHGKSLIYQVAPFVDTYSLSSPNCIIVIMPLVALMKEQASKLVAAGFKSKYVTKTEELLDTQCSHILMSPEFAVDQLIPFLRTCTVEQKQKYKFICVDESHCVTKWGESHDTTLAFREKYASLRECRVFLPNAVMIAMTATATLETQRKMCNMLSMEDPTVIRLSPNQPNIRYSVIKSRHEDIELAFDWLVPYIREHKSSTPRMLIFCHRLKHIGKLYTYLSGLCGDEYIEMYHRSTPKALQETILTRFRNVSSTLRVVICSSSFSMGLDIPELHNIIHYGPPANIDDYVQQSGRIGRDNTLSHALLICHPHGLKGRSISQSAKDYVRLIQDGDNCRRQFILNYFGFTKECNSSAQLCCDLCDFDKINCSELEKLLINSLLSDEYYSSTDLSSSEITDYEHQLLLALSYTNVHI